MECKSIEEVRNNIDIIDEKIIKLIGERTLYVKQAAKFKKNATEVKSEDRVEKVIDRLKKISIEYGAEPELTENLYRMMISFFVNMEMKMNHFK